MGWIDINQSIIFECNTTCHRAINMSQMLSFGDRAEKNRRMIAINDSGSEVEESILTESMIQIYHPFLVILL